jgi:hypothetical protein
MPDEQRTLSVILDDVAAEAYASGDQPILDLVEEISDLLGFDAERGAAARGAGRACLGSPGG